MADQSVWDLYFPEFADNGDRPLQCLMETARIMTMEAGSTLFRPGERCGHYVLVLEGVVRVHLITPNGREVLLYRVHPGHACILTTACLLGVNDYPAFGVTDTPVRALAVPAETFHLTLGQSSFFRTYVFSGFAERLSHVIGRMEELVEGDIDRMLARTLLSSSDGGVVRETHQSLAVAIGSAREVVSRHLKRFENQGWVSLKRNHINLIDTESLLRASGPDRPVK